MEHAGLLSAKLAWDMLHPDDGGPQARPVMQPPLVMSTSLVSEEMAAPRVVILVGRETTAATALWQPATCNVGTAV